MMGTIRPYLAFTLDVIVSKSAPAATSSTVPVTGVVPASTRPRTSLGCSVTLGLFRSRLALPEAEEVKTPTWPPSSGTIQVAVATAAPVLRKVATDTYFSCEIACPGLLPVMSFSSLSNVISARSGSGFSEGTNGETSRGHLQPWNLSGGLRPHVEETGQKQPQFSLGGRQRGGGFLCV